MEQYEEIDLYRYTESREAETENFLQMQTAYIAYMMISSYFSSCRCQNKAREDNLFLHYSDMRQREQMSIETQLDHNFEKEFYDSLEKFSHMHCEVIFSNRGENIIVYFRTGFEELLVNVTPTGEYTFERCGKWPDEVGA